MESILSTSLLTGEIVTILSGLAAISFARTGGQVFSTFFILVNVLPIVIGWISSSTGLWLSHQHENLSEANLAIHGILVFIAAWVLLETRTLKSFYISVVLLVLLDFILWRSFYSLWLLLWFSSEHGLPIEHSFVFYIGVTYRLTPVLTCIGVLVFMATTGRKPWVTRDFFEERVKIGCYLDENTATSYMPSPGVLSETRTTTSYSLSSVTHLRRKFLQEVKLDIACDTCGREITIRAPSLLSTAAKRVLALAVVVAIPVFVYWVASLNGDEPPMILVPLYLAGPVVLLYFWVMAVRNLFTSVLNLGLALDYGPDHTLFMADQLVRI